MKKLKQTAEKGKSKQVLLVVSRTNKSRKNKELKKYHQSNWLFKAFLPLLKKEMSRFDVLSYKQ
jgi:hypothetical protein